MSEEGEGIGCNIWAKEPRVGKWEVEVMESAGVQTEGQEAPSMSRSLSCSCDCRRTCRMSFRDFINWKHWRLRKQNLQHYKLGNSPLHRDHLGGPLRCLRVHWLLLSSGRSLPSGWCISIIKEGEENWTEEMVFYSRRLLGLMTSEWNGLWSSRENLSLWWLHFFLLSSSLVCVHIYIYIFCTTQMITF